MFRNGLYHITVEMLDDIKGGNQGVMVVRDGTLRGGDSFFYAYGTCTAANGKWKGEVTNQQHTRSFGERPVWEGKVATIGLFLSRTRRDTDRNFKSAALDPARHRNQRAGDAARRVARKKQDDAGQFFRRHPFCEICIRHGGAVGRGIDDRRQHGIDGDPALPFGGERFGEAVHAGFRSSVSPHSSASLKCARRTDIDDPP